jgi:AGCS family alanine or glycine:cation symporter
MSSRLVALGVFAALVALPLAQVSSQPEDPAPATQAAAAQAEVEVTEGEAPVGNMTAEEAVAALAAEVDADEAPQRGWLEERVDAAFSKAVGVLVSVLFFTLPGVTDESGNGVPFIVAWLFIGALVMTFWMKFVNIRAFAHSFAVVRGVYDDPAAEGEVSHFQALSSALSATVGLGNIAGVAIAVSVGGPGAIVWMIVAAFFGMTSKFVECTLGQKYRKVDAKGQVLGGPMRYLEVGLAERGLPRLGKALAVLFAVCCIGGSFGGGNMFQANQAYSAVNSVTPAHVSAELFGIGLMLAVGVVILGGIKRIAATAEKIVPLMCVLYVVAAAFVIAVNLHMLDDALGAIFSDAFSGEAMGGGILGVMIMGIRRAAFSNEAGIGSAAIAHSAARTKEPVREGIVALLEPFIDTVIVCLATAIVIVISGVLDTPRPDNVEGAVLTAAAFKTVISWFPLLLSIAIILFAYSTMISWSYYGERSWTYLFGERSSIWYRFIFLGFIFVGSVSSLGAVLDFSDLMILSMAFPNFIGLYLLAGVVRRDLDDYMSRLETGRMPRFK